MSRRNRRRLLLVVQMIAFSLVGLSSLLQSTRDDLSPELSLRMQSRAEALTRTADRDRKLLEQRRCNPSPSPRQSTMQEPAIMDEPSPAWIEDFARLTQYFESLGVGAEHALVEQTMPMSATVHPRANSIYAEKPA